MKNQFKGFYVSSAVLLLIAILLPILVNQCFINLFMKSAPLGNKEWLGFFGSYLGGIIGAFATLIALFATYKQNELQHRVTRDEMHEQNRLDILPFINYSWVSPETLTDGKVLNTTEHPARIHDESSIKAAHFSMLSDDRRAIKNIIHIELKNIGKGSAVNCKLVYSGEKDGTAIVSLLPKDTFDFYVLFPLCGKSQGLTLQFDDVQGRQYQQVIELEYGYKDANQQIDTVFFKHSDNQKPDWINKSKSC